MPKIETIVFGGGCFWCTEAVFKMLKGIIAVEPGYAGGNKKNPTYEEVSSESTGHAETIKVEYNPDIISFKDLLAVFFATHNSTTKNRQGDDVGEQYRSIILYTNEEQKEESEKFIKELNNSSPDGPSIVTEVKKLDVFYPAENYHKNYYQRNEQQPYCQIVINPKLKKVQERFAQLLKS
ncbi:MAG: peptide-methionine (S)-S-oxide reductase MsrA [Patescibacteria group bacterium]